MFNWLNFVDLALGGLMIVLTVLWIRQVLSNKRDRRDG